MGGFLIVVLSIFYILGFALLGATLWAARRSTQAAGWPTTPGTLTHAAVEERRDDDGDLMFEVKVRYAYTVDGTAYEGAQLAFGYAATNDRAAHDGIHRKLAGATVVDVRYDPAHPSVSCLSHGLHRSIWFGLVFAATWWAFLIGISVLLWLFHQPDTVLVDNLSVR